MSSVGKRKSRRCFLFAPAPYSLPNAACQDPMCSSGRDTMSASNEELTWRISGTAGANPCDP